MSAGRHIVLVGHGSRAPEANALLVHLAQQMASDLRAPVTPGYLEMTTPTIPDALRAAIAAGAERITVVPYFLSPGVHVARDIAAAVDTVRAQAQIEIDVAVFLGAHPEIPRLLAEIAAAPP